MFSMAKLNGLHLELCCIVSPQNFCLRNEWNRRAGTRTNKRPSAITTKNSEKEKNGKKGKLVSRSLSKTKIVPKQQIKPKSSCFRVQLSTLLELVKVSTQL